MERSLPVLVALSLVLMAVPHSVGQLADPEANVSSSEPVNQSTTVSVVADDDGTSEITLTTEGELANETASLTVPDDALALVDHVIGIVDGLVSDAVDLVIAICDAVAGIFGATCF